MTHRWREELNADADAVSGYVADAFDLLWVRCGAPRGRRNWERQRLLELFDVAGPHDPAVVAGRRAMTTAQF